MASSILDIGPLSETVSLRGVDIKLRGIGADALVLLLNKFPDLYKAIGQREDLDAASFATLGPDIVANIIATAAGEGDDPKVIETLKNLTIGEVMQLLEPILRMTFPSGFGPFVSALERLTGSVALAPSGKALATSSG